MRTGDRLMDDVMVVDPPGVGSVMAIAAHPDDIESWCAGTLAQAVDLGATVRLLLVTSGDKGSDDPSATSADVAARREAEAARAAQTLGIVDVVFLRYPDGDLEDTRALRRDLVLWVRRWRPRALFTHDPERSLPPYLGHRDHRIVGRAVLDAIFPLARDRLTFPEHAAAGLHPHAVSEAWLFASSAATSFVDIASSFDRKIAARLAHVSQTRDAEALRVSWRERAAEIGGTAALGLAEAFTVLNLA